MSKYAEPAVAAGGWQWDQSGNQDSRIISPRNPWYPIASARDDDELIDWKASCERLLADPDLQYPESMRAVLRLELDAIEAVQRRRAELNLRCLAPGHTIPSEFLQTLREHVDLAQLIGLDVDLRRAGRSYKGSCPFHDDKTPSLVVWTDERPGFRCFGCGVRGDAIQWLMAMQRVGFRSACRWLATWASLPFPEREQRKSRSSASRVRIGGAR